MGQPMVCVHEKEGNLNMDTVIGDLNMDLVIGGLIALVTAIITSVITHKLTLKQDRNRTLTDLKIKMATDFIVVAYEGLKYLQPVPFTVESAKHSLEVLQKSELIGIFFDDHIYAKTNDFQKRFIIMIGKRANGDMNHYKDEIKGMKGILKELRVDFKKLYSSGDFGSNLTQISQRKWLRR